MAKIPPIFLITMLLITLIVAAFSIITVSAIGANIDTNTQILHGEINDLENKIEKLERQMTDIESNLAKPQIIEEPAQPVKPQNTADNFEIIKGLISGLILDLDDVDVNIP